MSDSEKRSANRRVFLDIDDLSRWDESEIFQRFPLAEKLVVSGLEAGPPGAWDARIACDYPTVLYEDGRFRMWYSTMPEVESYDENADHGYACYAESEDGRHWRKPDLGLTGRRRYPGNNLLSVPGFCMGVVRTLPGGKFKYLGAYIQILPLDPDVTDVPGNSNENRGTFIYGSDDGLNWTRLTKVCQHGDNASLMVDPAAGRYLLFQKVGLMHGLETRRSWIGLQSHDGVHWEGYDGPGRWRECFVADDYDDLLAARRGMRIADYYGVTVHRVGNLYVSIENVFDIGLPLRSRFAQNPAGLCHFRLGFSHNGFNWRHPAGRPAWLELGRPGEFDAGFMVPGSNLLEHGEDMLLYYSGFPYRHGWCITTDFRINRAIPLAEHRATATLGLARIRRDRFASLASTYRGRFELDPDASGAPPLAADPRRAQFYVNAHAPNGAVRVALMDHRTKTPLPGFDFADCLPITADSIRAPVRYRQADIAGLGPEQRFYLAFELNKAEVFGYEWGPAS